MDRRVSAAVVIATLALSGTADAQVFKCKSASGATVYSQAPCGANATEVKTPSMKSTPAPQDGVQRDYRQDMLKSNERSNAAMAERNCLNAASANVWNPTNAQIGGYDRQIAGLLQQLRSANNNLAGAQWETGLRTQIAGLEQSKATARAGAESRMQSERQTCAQARVRAEQQIDQKFSSPAKPVG